VIGHECFRVTRVERGDGWAGYLWRAECKTCSWQGELHQHPLDTSADSIEHTRETTKAVAA
jgi:hypothetical protein